MNIDDTDYDIGRALDQSIAPRLGTMETARSSAQAKSKGRLPIALLGVAVAAVLAWLITVQFDVTWFIILVAVIASGIFAYIWVSGPTSEFESEQRDTVMAAICDHIGDMSYQHSCTTDDFDLKSFSDASVVLSYTSHNIEDLIKGSYRNCRFSIVEAKLTRRSGKNSSTVFDGLLFQISLPRRVSDRIVIAKDYSQWGSMVNSLAGWFVPGNRVEIAHARFEEKFEVYAKDAAEARSLITHDFVENFLGLPKVLGTEEVLAAFVEDQFLLSANSTKDFLDGFSASKPISELRELFAKTVEETRLIHRVIDQLLEGDRYRS